MKKVKFVTKTITVGEGEEAKEVGANYLSPDKKVYRAGQEVDVTDRHAGWLQKNGWIEPLRKENKTAAKRETK